MKKKTIAKLIFRGYRISKEDDKYVKLNAKKFGGESAYIRALIREGTIWKTTSMTNTTKK